MEEGSRWTCEACGCNTNASSDTNCGICGTSQSGPSILRRAGYSAARAAWLARPRGANSNRLDDLEEEHDLWESVVHGISDELILDGADRGRFVESTRQRFLDAARAFAHRNGAAEAAPSVDPDVIWEAATTNTYSPYWMSSSGSEIEVGEGSERRHLAHVPSGSGEGQAIRSEHPLPRNSTVGFRVAFEHPTAEVAGANMGGCYLVGVTTSSFSAWSENKGLQNSPFFFGIEDGGLLYEGSSRTRREAEVSSQNSHGVLFGSRDVVTCISDGRTLTFWRNDTLLGTLVNSLPRSLPLFPVVVPFNSEVTVAITNVQCDPLPILRTFAVDWKKVQQEKEGELRARLAAQRSVLIHEDGSLSARLRDVLRSIFDMHEPHHDRLWYRCGWKLEKLQEITQGQRKLTFEDFCSVIERVVVEDLQKNSSNEKANECQEGDKVELVNGYEKFGDAKGGPLQVGDRGIVVDIQRGQNGEQRSIRVLHNSRRWYYQPQAIRSERSGLIECTSVWFLRDILRSHGFDHTTLDSLVGKPVTASSWRVGDIVVPKDSSNLVGRIVAASKEKDAVKVQYSNPAFLEAVGLPAGDPLEVCRIENCRLKHSTVVDVAVGNSGIQGRGQSQEKLASSSDKTRSDICSLSRLERIDIDALVKECRRSSDSLASLFAGGLPDAFLSALTVAERLMNSLEPPDDLAERISAVGDLAIAIADQLFGDPLAAPKIETEDSGSNDSAQGETSDLARTRQRARLSHRNRRLRLIRETSLHGEEDLDRRSMLLSLVSRGGRRTGSRFLNEDRPVPHLLGSPGDLFGESWDMAAALSSANNTSRARGAPASDSQAPTPRACENAKPRSFLDSILRCRGDLSQLGAKQGGTADHHAFVRQLVQDGIVADNVDWTKALIEAQSEKTNRRIPAILRSVSDEEGTPLLYLAVFQRCSPEMIGRLLDWGAPSRPEEVRMAAETDQPASLSLILQRSPLQDVDLDVGAFSQSVKEVFENSKVRQLELEKAMTEAAGKFMVDILHKLFELALCSRRLCSAKMESCGRVICEVLVGNVLLASVQKSQSETGEHKDDSDCPEDANLGGLLGLLPRSVLADCLFLDKCHITTFLLVCEEYLCGKDMTDIASGLTMLFALLRSFSHLSASPMVVRFGLDKFVARHQSLASDRITKIVSKRGNADPRKQSNVLCPKNHVAVLHITRHSSFRCDLCGNGVDRGCPMHGCRQCDWDACEKCTDAAETGLVKCNVLKDLSSLCQEYLSTTKESDFTAEESTRFTKTLDYLSTSGSAAELSDVISRLKNRHVSALSDLAALLLEPGSVTIHEFVSIVLPALHRAFVIQTIPACGGRQSKKAKVSELEGRPSEGRHDLLEFCQESLLELTANHDIDTSSETEKQAPIANAMDSDSSDNDKNEINGTETDSSTPVGRQNGKVDISYSTGASELLRRLHQVLSFHEGVLESLGSSPKCNELQALKAPIELKISPSTFNTTTSISCGTSVLVHAEPLVPIGDICRHILRIYRITDNEYVSFCRRLANEKAIIVDRPNVESARWRIARVLSFDEASGANTVQYATSWKRGCESDVLNVDSDLNASALFRFSGPTSSLVLAARQYFVFCRTPATANSDVPSKTTPPEIQAQTSSLSHIVGTRVESNCEDPNEWIMYTVVAVTSSSNCTDTSSGSFILVSDDGQLFSGVSSERIRTQSLSDIAQEESTRARRSGRMGREDRHGLFPFFARQRGETSADAVTSSTVQLRALKRSWSALGLVDEMHPVDLRVVEDDPLTANDGVVHSVSLPCSLDDAGFHLVAEVSSMEAQPEINIDFSCHEKLPGLDVSDKQEATLIWALREISHKQEKVIDLPPESPFSLHFSLKMNPDQCRLTFPPDFASVKIPASKPLVEDDWMERPDCKSRKLSSRSLSQEELDTESLVCDGFNSTCVECMEVLVVLSECAENPSSSTTRDGPKLPGLANTTLSKKLSDQLDDPVRVIGGALPHWCLKGPSFAPCVFAYDTRRALLERAAFGVSRSTLKQQEAKVNVQRLRQRMASLRSKAVELVGEAFSGGAEDPTALQLQADELYGMEEALAMKVRAAFRAQDWQEHALQVAKVAVRREYLISDAAAAMEKYSTDNTIRMRRLEVRFSGESGFDAASGDEAGVTRGFYADCAEALLSADNVASVYCSSSCLSVAAIPDLSAAKPQPMAVEELDNESPKLPLWIPDMDNGNQVVIPTPRVNKRSGPGIFPRPLPNYHPQHGEVLGKFRLMGRLFAAAMRDGFMFPLPLSSSFLKLVQNCCTSRAISATHGYTVLASEDLPRPGFLGGEVYGAESTVCKALDELDAVDPPLPRVQLMRRCEEIAKDKDFARKALGKTYDCSFDEYFQDRTFVDPFDPGQGADAVPLCSKGASKPVTIYNIREWVALAKRFILHEGVVEQAKAFRSGIKDFFPPEYLSLFTPLELQNDVCGVGDQVDNWDEAAIRGKGAAEALVAVAAIGGEGGAALSRRFGPSSPTIGFLVNALKRGSPTQRRQFLSFVTSVPIVTPGNIEIVPILSPSGEFLPISDPCCLPRANTCTRRLYLPKFDDFESFEKVLWAVVSAENQFKGFWEWGG